MVKDCILPREEGEGFGGMDEANRHSGRMMERVASFRDLDSRESVGKRYHGVANGVLLFSPDFFLWVLAKLLS